MSVRIRRAAAAVAITAASLVGTAALATPAWAADTAKVSFGNLIVSGGPEANSMRFTRAADGTVTLRDANASVSPGTGCVAVDAKTVRCSGVENLNVSGGAGDDLIDNDTGSDGGNPNTGLPASIGGSDGNDNLQGSTGRDDLGGGLGFDRASGSAGIDSCSAEVRSSTCEN